MNDDLDFSPDEVIPPRPRPYNPNRPTTGERFLAFLTFFAAALFVTGVAVEWPFWSLWLMGERTTATVTEHKERLVGRVLLDDGSLASIKETGLVYHFTDTTGAERTGLVWLQEGVDKWVREGPESWRKGDNLPIMYFGTDPATSMPASFGYYWAYDTLWLLMLWLDGGGLGGAAGCYLGWRLLRHARLRRNPFRIGA